MSVSQLALDSYITYAKEQLSTNDVHYWKRGTPYSQEVTRTIIGAVDAFIVVLPDNAFKFNINSLPSGTRSELNYAIADKERGADKHIFIAYTNREDGAMFYSATYNMGGLIEGVSGSKRNFREYCSNFKTKTAEEAHQDLEDWYTQQKRNRKDLLVQTIVKSTGLTATSVKDHLNFLDRNGGAVAVRKWLVKIGVAPAYNKIKSVELGQNYGRAVTLQKEEYDRRILLLRSH